MKTLFATMILVTASFAQPAAERPAPTFDDLKTYLSLTDAQFTALTTAHQSAVTNAKTCMDQIREKQQSLRSLTDADAIAKVMAEINVLQEKVRAIMDAARTAAIGTLTTAQQTKLKTLQDAMALRMEISQAGALGLLTTPEGAAAGPGGGFGPRGFGGPRRQLADLPGRRLMPLSRLAPSPQSSNQAEARLSGVLFIAGQFRSQGGILFQRSENQQGEHCGHGDESPPRSEDEWY